MDRGQVGLTVHRVLAAPLVPAVKWVSALGYLKTWIAQSSSAGTWWPLPLYGDHRRVRLRPNHRDSTAPRWHTDMVAETVIPQQ